MLQQTVKEHRWKMFGVPHENFPDGEVGIEIELEGNNLPELRNKLWTTKNDPSLHNGLEYVLVQPVMPEFVEEALSKLNLALRRNENTVIRQSSRTSVHVHLNVNNLLTQELYTFICTCLLFENFLTAYSGPEREGNHFCLRASDAEYLPILIANSVASERYLNDFNRDDIRYSALNLKAVPTFGSVEFRSFRGSTDTQEILSWVKILLDLKEVSLKFESPLALLEAFQEAGPEKFITLLGNEEFKKFCQTRFDFRKRLKDNFFYVFNIAHAPLNKRWLTRNKIFEIKTKTAPEKKQPQRLHTGFPDP